MDMNSINGLMDLLVFGAGLYIMYSYIMMVTKKELKDGVLISSSFPVKKCKDLDGYIGMMKMPTLALALCGIACGGTGLYQDYVGHMPSMVTLVCNVLFFASLAWFIVVTKKAQKKYW